MGRMVASTLKLGIAILNGGNSTVQQVLQCMPLDSLILHFTMNTSFLPYVCVCVCKEPHIVTLFSSSRQVISIYSNRNETLIIT